MERARLEDPAPAMPAPHWYADAPSARATELRDSQFMQQIREAPGSQRFAVPARLFRLAELQANFAGQMEGVTVGLGVGGFLALCVWLSS